jgi:hypothetical protein
VGAHDLIIAGTAISLGFSVLFAFSAMDSLPLANMYAVRRNSAGYPPSKLAGAGGKA